MISRNGRRAGREPVAGHRRTESGARAGYGKAAPPQAKPPESLFVPGLTAEAVAVIAGALVMCEVEPKLEAWSLPNRPRLHSRGDVTAGLDKRPSPAARTKWLVGVPYVGKVTLESLVHAKPGRDPFESLTAADTRLGVRSVVASFDEARPDFTVTGAQQPETYRYYRSPAMADLPVVVRERRVVGAARHVVLSDPDLRPAARWHVAEVALHSAFAIDVSWQEAFLDETPENGGTISHDAAQFVMDAIAAADPEVIVPVASSLVLKQSWPASPAAAAA
ncbi:MAG TPA: hypothetical protein VLI54_06675 [Bacillota bacterium]|nr:hypothetical protein [Bacillota bacterium]